MKARLVILHAALFYLWALSTVLRIYLPPENAASFCFLVLIIIVAFLAYPFVAGVAFKVFWDLEEGRTPGWKEISSLLRERYLPLLAVSAVVLCTYLLVSFAILLIFGHELLEFFWGAEAGMDKGILLLRAAITYGTLFLLALELPPVLFPMGIVVLFQPSSEYFFMAMGAIFIAIALLVIPVLKVGLWLPHALLGPRQSLRASFREAWTLTTPRVMKNLFKSLLSSIGAALALYIAVWFILGPFVERFPAVILGRWQISLPMIILWGFFILLPGIVGLRFYEKRVAIYKKAFSHLRHVKRG